MKKLLIIIPAVLLLCSCALEVANVIGPAGGYVFFDKRNYTGGWRYLECCPINAGEIEDFIEATAVTEAQVKLVIFSYNGFKDWELPDEDELKQMLRSFRWELTRFENKHQFISSTGTVYRNNYENNVFAEQEKVNDAKGRVSIRPIRRF
ncbi:MAG: hypothetical protein FWB86_09210 [Treponema sp.]|nr:hypothetical protein [Treponema sp.]MCL2251252.1 hypothetical protein [Treponema sp.]